MIVVSFSAIVNLENEHNNWITFVFIQNWSYTNAKWHCGVITFLMQIKTIEILKLLDCLNNVMVETSSHSFYESSITKIVPISYYFIKARLLSIKFAIQLKKWCEVNLTNRWRPIVYNQFIDVSRNSLLVWKIFYNRLNLLNSSPFLYR